ncbi:IclR family transcriptional regulator [Kibdelosporangium philippinense]|uniref:IclR family transcriptional regulator n=1 Tax=Kibdelosporangium philippinense TaxID=211113 RepID=A0ABS8ZT43_9PSEU|nr:IclR family transcriptional regulator [Kibdelosporangium philippinense]MCE7010880.1 IclR family transcriptional regulator [Kibdelosporangium philippinense]
MASDVPAVASSVRILERLAAEWPHPVAPRDLVNDLGLNRSTCYNILATLQRAGWVTSTGERGGWMLGPKLLTLTGVTDSMAATVAQQEIDDLARRIGFIVFLASPDGSSGYVVTAKAERQVGVRVTVGVGEDFTFSAPALMQAFHAWLPRTEVDDLVARFGLKQFTPHTVTDLDSLHSQLALTRKRGFSTSLQQYDMAQSGVAAPVFDRRGQVTRVVCSLAFFTELHEDNVQRIGAMVSACADRITARTGGMKPPEVTDD